MKKILSLITAAALMLGSTTAFAQENGVSLTEETIEVSAQSSGDSFVVGDFNYTELKDGTLEVSCNNMNITKAEIPATVNGKSVTSIGREAFWSCTSLTSVTIPNSVTSIGEGAFQYCTSLTSVTIPNSVTSIGTWAFEDCTSLTTVTIPNSVTSIGNVAFSRCTSLTSVTIPDSVTSIGTLAFNGCTSLTSVTIPNSVTSIGWSAFSGCTSLTSVTIPDSVTSIDDSAFRGCTCLTSVTIPDSVTSIGMAAFGGCTSLTNISVDTGNRYYCSKNGILFDKDKTELVTYPAGKTDKSYAIPDSVIWIGNEAFNGCSNLTSVTIPDGVTWIGNAFYDSTSLTAIIVDTENEYFCSENGVLFDRQKTKLITYPSGKTDKSYAIPDSVTSIDRDAFYGSTSLTSVTILNSVTSIGWSAFSGCTSLTSVTIPDSVTSIENFVFSMCTSLTSVTIPDSVTSIGFSAFNGCTSLTSVTIPDSVTSIGTFAFGCENLKNVYYSGTEEQWKTIQIDSGNFDFRTTIHYNSTGPSGTPVDIAIEAPTGVDTSDQTVTVTVNGETKTLPITDGLLDISSLANGTYTLTFSAKNCAPRAYENITVSNGTATGLSKVELNLYGDINGDGKLTLGDVLKANAAARNSKQLTGYEKNVADINNDGNITLGDVLKMNAHARNSKLLW